ncbi:MAG TPA: hypothetical protein VIH62_09830, partial [Xanthobacteraceae bacterium]
ALVLFLIASGIVFISALRHLIDMVFGEPQAHQAPAREGKLSVPIVVVAVGLLLVLGLWMPLSLSQAIGSAAAVLAG